MTQITLSGSEPLALRQMTAVLLKQYVDAHWSSLSDKFVAPEVTPGAKVAIRQMLPEGLKESISKVSNKHAFIDIAYFNAIFFSSLKIHS